MPQADVKMMYNRIQQLKKEKDVTLLAHYYMPAELQRKTTQGGIADYVGDSLGLSVEAQNTPARNILFCGVRFMAETALVINPDKNVFMPDVSAGCSLASSISAQDVRDLKKQYPGVPVMGYINTYAETKTELDICCTSRNAVAIASSLEGDRLIFVPDLYMGQNLKRVIEKQCGKELILWKGTCEVHEQFNNAMVEEEDGDTEILMHWEVPGDMVNTQLSKRKGIVGSTGDILQYVKQSTANKFMLASECDLGVALKEMNADKEFITPCIKCAYMKQNTLEKVLQALEAIGTAEETNYRITLNDEVLQKARKPVLRMLNYN